MLLCFLFYDTSTTEIYTSGHTLSLYDALPILTGGFTLADKDTLTNEPGVGPLRVTVDTMIATILRQAPTDARASVAAWRQISDILAQRSEEHTSEPQSLMRISYAVFCLKKKTK